MDGALTDRLWRLIEPVAASLGLELVEVVWRQRGPASVLRVFADRPGGISLGDCERLSRRLNPLLDAEELLSGRYQLEVSSPGIDRPLRRPADFARALGERICLRLCAVGGRPRTLVGRLREAGESLQVELDDGSMCTIPVDEIEEARRQVEF